jgi:GTP pyrophosphokinase
MNLASCRQVFERTVQLLHPRLAPGETEQLENAFKLAASAHHGQRRHSGDPFLIHAVEVGFILAEMGADATTVIAGLLHDVLEDTATTGYTIRQQFGRDIYRLVFGVTEVGREEVRSSDPLRKMAVKKRLVSKTLRRLLLAASHDPRVLLIKLADRLHNMRTLQHLPPEKRRRKALETLEIYAPLAHRLGVAKLRWELEDRSFMFLHPEAYASLAAQLNTGKITHEQVITEIVSKLKERLEELEIDARVFGRSKHLYSVWRKMKKKHLELQELGDLYGFRVITNGTRDCYSVLGLVHSLWRPVPGSFKDYIANPKPNLYQSLHTTIIGTGGQRIEVQIRSERMDFLSEYGLAAHFSYKHNGELDVDLDDELLWLRRIVDWEKQSADSFVNTVKIDLFAEQLFIISPKGDAFDLPQGSTVLDFAFHLHSDMGNHCSGALVNGLRRSLNYRLNAGDRVEVLTDKGITPRRSWLRFARTRHAKRILRKYFRLHSVSPPTKRQLIQLLLKGNLTQYYRLMDKIALFPELELTKTTYSPYGSVNIRINARVPSHADEPIEKLSCVETLLKLFPGLKVEVKR